MLARRMASRNAGSSAASIVIWVKNTVSDGSSASRAISSNRSARSPRNCSTIKDLGHAKKITMDKDSTIIIEGAGSSESTAGRVRQLRTQIEDTTSDYDREKLQERLAKLVGGVAIINVGAATETAGCIDPGARDSLIAPRSR